MTVDYTDVELTRIPPIKFLTTVSTRYYQEEREEKFLLEGHTPCTQVSFHLSFQIL